MTSIRKQLADKIAARAVVDAVAMDVYPFGFQPEELRKPAVAVFRDAVEQGTSNDLGHGFKVQIFGAGGYATESTEDALDTLLDVVLMALRGVDVVAWSRAERKVFNELFQGWEIDVSWNSLDYYKTNI